MRKIDQSSTRLIAPLTGSIGIIVLLTSLGCGAQIRPDGPKRVVFNEPDGSRRIIEVSPASELRATAIDRLMRLTADPSPEIRANTIEALSPVRAQVEPVVALALSDPNAGVRTVAAMVAGRSQLRSLAPTIREMLGDDSPFVRSAAMFALGSFGEEIDLSELSLLLFEDENPRVRSQIAFILGELGEESAVPMLLQSMRQPMNQASVIQKKLFRLQVAEALIKLGHDDSIDAVRAALYPSRPDELEATALAVQIIGQIRDEPSIDQLIYLADPDADTPMPAEVRLGVASALAEMGYREGSFVADEYMDNQVDAIRAQSAIVYGKTQSRANLGKLEVMMLNDPSPLTQVAAAGAIVDYTERELGQKDAGYSQSGR